MYFMFILFYNKIYYFAILLYYIILYQNMNTDIHIHIQNPKSEISFPQAITYGSNYKITHSDGL